MKLKRIIAGIAAITLVFTASPSFAAPEHVSASSGDSGYEMVYDYSNTMYRVYEDHAEVSSVSMGMSGTYRGQDTFRELPVTAICDNAFYNAGHSLTGITFGENVKTIGKNAFSRCERLESVVIPDTIESIGAGAFKDCAGLTEITLPDSLKEIGEGTFENCTSLKNITLPKELATIGDRAFYGCTNLSEINIPESLTKFGGNVFYGTKWLKSAAKADGFAVVNGVLVGIGELSGDVVVPDGVKKIAPSTFSFTENIDSVDIPESVKAIDEDAFLLCNVKEIIVRSEECVIKGGASTISNECNYDTGMYIFSGTIRGIRPSYDTSDIDGLLPTTPDEWRAFVKKNGYVTTLGDYILCCGSDNGSTGYKFKSVVSGPVVLAKQVKIEDPVPEGASGGGILYIDIYKAKDDGYVKAASCEARSWTEDSEKIIKGEKEYYIDEQRKISELEKLPEEVESLLPKSIEEWNAFVKNIGYVSSFGNYIVCCGRSSGSSGYSFKSVVSGTGAAEIVKQYSISNPPPPGATGGGSLYVDVYKASAAGDLEAVSYEGAEWVWEESKIANGRKRFYVDSDLNICDLAKTTTQIDGLLPKSFAEMRAFVNDYGNVSDHGNYLVFCGNVTNYSLFDNSGTDKGLICSRMGDGKLTRVKQYAITDDGYDDGSGNVVIVYKAEGEGTVAITENFVWYDTDENITKKQCLIQRVLSIGSDLDIKDMRVENVENIIYTETDDEIVLVKAHEQIRSDVELPEQIGGKPIKKIPDGFFKYYNIKNVTIPKSVTAIGKSAFEMCPALESVTIMNPDCTLFDSSSTVSNYMDKTTMEQYFRGLLRSTSKSGNVAKYAAKYGCTFGLIDEPAAAALTGDTNCDGEVNLADAVLIMQSIANPAKYPLSDDARANADVDGGGVTAMDALKIQQFTLGLIEELK